MVHMLMLSRGSSLSKLHMWKPYISFKDMGTCGVGSLKAWATMDHLTKKTWTQVKVTIHQRLISYMHLSGPNLMWKFMSTEILLLNIDLLLLLVLLCTSYLTENVQENIEVNTTSSLHKYRSFTEHHAHMTKDIDFSDKCPWKNPMQEYRCSRFEGLLLLSNNILSTSRVP